MAKSRSAPYACFVARVLRAVGLTPPIVVRFCVVSESELPLNRMILPNPTGDAGHFPIKWDSKTVLFRADNYMFFLAAQGVRNWNLCRFTMLFSSAPPQCTVATRIRG
jgi:hypothetical protein